MRNSIVILIGISIFGLSGCISIHSEKAPVNEPEKVIVVPDNAEKKVRTVPDIAY